MHTQFFIKLPLKYAKLFAQNFLARGGKRGGGDSHSDIQQKEAPSEAVSEDTFSTSEVYIACCVGFA